MTTYRLNFSENIKTLETRIKKALSSRAKRVLCTNFKLFPQEFRELAPDVIWAKEFSKKFLDIEKNELSQWDELHILVQEPESVYQIDLHQFHSIVLQPNDKREKANWLLALRYLDNKIELKNIFIEFDPWGPERPYLFTTQEVVSFLYELKFHFPNWKPQRRPGVNLWDWRIASSFELEAEKFEKREYNFISEMPLISIIVPTYNNKYFLGNVLSHLANQTRHQRDYEVIVVDDGSTDKTREYLNIQGIPKNLQLTYIYWPRSLSRKRGDSLYRAGLSRNLGVRNSRSEQILFLDSDMLVPTDFVARAIEELKENDVIQFPRFHILQDRSSRITQYLSIQETDCYIEEEEYWKKFFDSSNWMDLEKYWKYTCTYGLGLKKKDFYDAGRFAHFYVSYGFEDTELGYRLSEMKKKFKLVPLKLLHLTSYSLSEYNFSKKRRQKLLEKTAKLFFLNTLEIENFHHLEGLMQGESAIFFRLKKAFDFLNKSKLSHGDVQQGF